MTLWLSTFLILVSSFLANAQAVLAPCYDAKALREYRDQTPAGKEPRVWLVGNVDSGPGGELDAEQLGLIDQCRRKGFKLVYYVDAVVGYEIISGIRVDYSPQIVRNGEFFKAVSVTGKRFKTAPELELERMAWLRYGSKPDAWFLDDVSEKATVAMTTVAKWPGLKVFNPGCAFTLPTELSKRSDVVLVISEQAKAWPRALTPWEKSNPQRCAVMGLSVTADSLPAFIATTAGLGWRWASPLDDQWRAGKSAYTQGTPYLKDMLK